MALTRCVVILFRPLAKDFAALDDELSEAIRLLFAEVILRARRKVFVKGWKSASLQNQDQKRIGRLVEVCRLLEYSSILEEGFRKIRCSKLT